MYNVLEKLRSGEALTAKERVIHEQGIVSVLRQLHDESTPPCSMPTAGPICCRCCTSNKATTHQAGSETREEAARL